jgi:phage terminase small subunit
MSLSGKQRAFVHHYLACWNGTEAARRAGYSDKTACQQASRLLTNVNIQGAIQDALDELAMSAGEVLLRLTAQARGSLADFISIDSDHPDTWTLDLEKARQTGAIHQIKKIKIGKYGTEIEMYDAQAALVKLGEHHQLFGKTPDLLKHLDVSQLSPEQLERIAHGDDPLAVLLATSAGPGTG